MSKHQATVRQSAQEMLDGSTIGSCFVIVKAVNPESCYSSSCLANAGALVANNNDPSGPLMLQDS